MPNFGDPLWGEEDWNGAPTAPFTFPPSDEERGRIDIYQVRASVKSGGKSVPASQFVTTVNPGPDGSGGMWQGGDWIYSGASAAPTTHTEVLVDHLGNPILTSTGNWVYVTGVPN